MQTEFDFLNHEVNTVEDALAIRVSGDVAPTGGLTAGKYIYLKGHSTLPNGGYHVGSSNIAAGDTLSLSNLVSDAEGITNGINSKLAMHRIVDSKVTIAAGSSVDVMNADAANSYTFLLVCIAPQNYSGSYGNTALIPTERLVTGGDTFDIPMRNGSPGMLVWVRLQKSGTKIKASVLADGTTTNYGGFVTRVYGIL